MLISLFYIGFTLLMLSSILTHFVFTPIYSEQFYRVRRAILNILAAPGRRLRRGPISWYDSRRKEFDNIVSNFRIPSYRYLKVALTDRPYPDP